MLMASRDFQISEGENPSSLEESVTAFLTSLTNKNALPGQIKEKDEYHKQLLKEHNDSSFITLNQAEQIYNAADDVQRLKTKLNEVEADHERNSEELVKFFKHLMNKKVRVEFMGSLYELRYSITGLVCHQIE